MNLHQAPVIDKSGIKNLAKLAIFLNFELKDRNFIMKDYVSTVRYEDHPHDEVEWYGSTADPDSILRNLVPESPEFQGEKKVGCGTACCAAGWAVVNRILPENPVDEHYLHDWADYCSQTFYPNIASGDELSYEIHSYLFGSKWGNDPKLTAKRLALFSQGLWVSPRINEEWMYDYAFTSDVEGMLAGIEVDWDIIYGLAGMEKPADHLPQHTAI